MNEIRMDPLTREWVIVAPNRDRRPIQPSRCPFCVGSDEIDPSKQVQIVPNRYAALSPNPDRASGQQFRSAFGFNEIVVESLNHDADFCNLPLSQAEAVLKVVLERIDSLYAKDGIRYVHFFRNRGKEIGVTISHPHSQIYAMPFVPPRIKTERKVFETFRPCVLCRQSRYADKSGRLVLREGSAIAYVPFAPRWPYEVHIQSDHVLSFGQLESSKLREVVHLLQSVLNSIDTVLGKGTAYTFSLHSAPKGCKQFHAHFEVAPVVYDRTRVRFTAGVERGTGTPVLDRSPEERARELREASKKPR
ncbi:MAG: hypothetical protein QW767_01520 [Thermoprotei archaeon]